MMRYISSSIVRMIIISIITNLPLCKKEIY
nr:MAG TPA: hypothetical protein [Caudoviricetes sp.]